jgi:hypothetical protein
MNIRIPTRGDFDSQNRVTINLTGWFGSMLRWIMLRTTHKNMRIIAEQDDRVMKAWKEEQKLLCHRLGDDRY